MIKSEGSKPAGLVCMGGAQSWTKESVQDVALGSMFKTREVSQDAARCVAGRGGRPNKKVAMNHITRTLMDDGFNANHLGALRHGLTHTPACRAQRQENSK